LKPRVGLLRLVVGDGGDDDDVLACFQLTGVATLCFDVSWQESSSRSTSSKLRPATSGSQHRLDFFPADDEHDSTVALSAESALTWCPPSGRILRQGHLQLGIADHRVGHAWPAASGCP